MQVRPMTCLNSAPENALYLALFEQAGEAIPTPSAPAGFLRHAAIALQPSVARIGLWLRLS